MKNIEYYNKNELAVIPVRPRTKKPAIENWQKRAPEENNPCEFKEDSNIGVVLGDNSGGLVDIDLDTPDAIRLAPYFLPETGWKFGRASAENSHWIYRVEGHVGRVEKLKINGNTNFVEYRSTGGMTVFPVSIHPSGESVEWSVCNEPSVVTRDELYSAINRMRVCGTIIPKYAEGSRNDIVNALTGRLKPWWRVNAM